jgi:hypothetical protein
MAAEYDLYPVTLTTNEGYMVRLENSIEIGNSALWGSLDITSYIYSVYDASVGLQQNSGWQIGACDDIDFERSQDIEAVEIGNVVDSGLFEIASEETNLTFAAREWKPNVLARAFGTTYSVVTTKSGLIEFGGGCNITSRPVVVRGTNVSCNASSITDLTDGVDYFTLTLYDCYTVEGVTLNFRVREDAPIPLAMRAKPVLSLSAGERVGNLYMGTD